MLYYNEVNIILNQDDAYLPNLGISTACISRSCISRFSTHNIYHVSEVNMDNENVLAVVIHTTMMSETLAKARTS